MQKETQTIQVDFTPEQRQAAETFLKRLTFDHFLSCTDGAAGGLNTTGGAADQAYEMQAAIAQIRAAVSAELDPHAD